MRGLRTALILAAVSAGVATMALTERPVHRAVHYEPLAWQDAGALEVLARVRAEYARAGVAVRQQSVSADERSVLLTGVAPPGGCVSVIAASSGRWRIEGVHWWPYGRPRPPVEAQPRSEPYRPLAAESVCPMRQSAEARSQRFEVRVARAGEGQAEVLVAEAAPPALDAAGIADDRVVVETRDWRPALLRGGALAGFLLLLGLMIESGLRNRREPDALRSLRRLTLALPAGLERELSDAIAQAPRSPRAARALRDRLVELAPHVSAATFCRWRDAVEPIDARHGALLTSLRERAPEGRGSGYRARERGLVVLSLLVRHRCELPELPAALDLEGLRFALESALPYYDEELVSVDVIVHPRDRADALDPAQVEALFPELAPVGAATEPCASCEAPVRGATCPACGVTRAPSPVAEAA
jgi:hypothetical protein